VAFRDVGRLRGHRRLNLDHASHCIDHAGELEQQPVTGGLDDAPAMGSDRRIDYIAAQCLQCRQRAAFVPPHEARISFR
jgi:hypothetical protein